MLEGAGPTGAHTHAGARVCQHALYREGAAAREGLHTAQVGVQSMPLHSGFVLVTGQSAGELEGGAPGHRYHRLRGIHMEGLA